jgi:hypothetical protein
MTDQNNELVLAVKEINLEPSKVESLLTSFSKNFQEAKQIAADVKSIVVTDVSQTDLMNKARESRLSLKNIRVEVEKTRISLKEQSLREGKAIDGMANIIKALIIPVEEHLEKQEKFAELKEQKRLADKYAERIEKLSVLVDDITLYNVKEMSDEAFENLIIASKEAREAKKQAELKVEQDRIEWERKQKLLQDRKLELAPYREFLEDEITIDTTDEDYQKLLKIGKETKSKYDKEQEKIRKENDELRKKNEVAEKAKQEAEDKLRVEKEAQEKKELDEKKAEEEKLRLEDEAKKKAILAPDKEKLLELAKKIELIELPNVASKEAGEVINGIEQDLKTIVSHLIERSRTL